MQNVEFKSELRELDAARLQCTAMGAKLIGVLEQTDTYFRLADGRLKRREAEGEPVEWIYYHRADRVEPRLCHYSILSDAQARRRWGTASLRTWLTVRKRRELWMQENVRIHLDEVEELGTFIEFEAIVSRDFSVDVCQEEVAGLREAFAPILGEPVSRGYADLMADQMETAEE